MAVYTSISRLVVYYRRHGVRATVPRVALALTRALRSKGLVLFYCDLSEEATHLVDSRPFVQVEQRRSSSELSPDELQAMTSFWNADLVRRKINERFAAGAMLWLMKTESETMGYGWTLQGKTIEPHYFPLGQRDAHLFDFYVFAQYRGRGMNPFLVNYILRSLAAAGVKRALIEAAEYNRSQLVSLKKTPFNPFGCARRWSILGYTMVWWSRNALKGRLAG
jgi:ribosomal protein S18 acetylase RimI-like enzyme